MGRLGDDATSVDVACARCLCEVLVRGLQRLCFGVNNGARARAQPLTCQDAQNALKDSASQVESSQDTRIDVLALSIVIITGDDFLASGDLKSCGLAEGGVRCVDHRLCRVGPM